MAISINGQKRIRKTFGRIPEVAPMPNLIEVQRSSYDHFLQMGVAAEQRANVGLQEVFRSVFPIRDFSERAQLEFVRYELETPKYDVDECQQRGINYAAPLKVTLRLVVWDIDEDTGSRSIHDIKEQDVYMGDMPLMTRNGTFIINGTERVIVSQMHRSPGVFFDHDKGKTHSSGKYLFAARVIPYRGSWLDFEFDAKDHVYVRIDRRRKLPATTLLLALDDAAHRAEARPGQGRGQEPAARRSGRDVEGGDPLGVLRHGRLSARRERLDDAVPGGAIPRQADSDLIDADTGEVRVQAGERMTPRLGRRLREAGLANVLAPHEELIGRYFAQDLINEETGEVYFEAGDEITEAALQLLEETGAAELPVLDIDLVSRGADSKGPYIRSTLAIDKNATREDALIDIYRVMRPGEPPTLETAETLFNSLFFDPERYDLSAVGRVKMNSRLGVDAEDTVRVLRKQDILAILNVLVDLKDGRGEIDDIDHLGNRRVRSVGELMENQYRVGLLRMERAIRERMSSVEIDTVMPHDLINAKPAAAAVREFFGSSQLSQFMDQTNPLSEITHKRRLSALGPGGLTRERAGFEVRDVHPTHYGRICPIETPEGPNIGLINSLATYARVNQYGFIETPYRKVEDGKVTDEVIYISAMNEGRYSIAQANVPIDDDGRIAEELTNCRKNGDFVLCRPEDVDLIDVSPKQLVSVAAALIPFLENDDANRALMGSNMQRQAVPLIRAEAPLVGTGMEETVARDSGVTIIARRAGIVDQVDATRIVVRAQESSAAASGVDIYNLLKFQRSNQNTCINQRPLVKVGQQVRAGDILADGPSTEDGELALGRNVLCAFMPWNGYNFEDSILISERIVSDDVFTSIHIEEFEASARDTKLGQEEITRDIPNVGEEALKNLDEAGIVYIGAEVKPGDILVGKVTPKGESPMTPEEKLLRAIFGEKASDVRDTSLRLPPGVSGTIVEVRVFSRRGVDKDERALAIERAEIERLAKDRDDEREILERSFAARLKELLLGQISVSGPRGMKSGSEITEEVLAEYPPGQWRQISMRDDIRMADIEALKKQMDDAVRELDSALREQGRKIAARRRAAARRHEDGQGLRGGETQAAARRQDGRPARQQGRHLADHAVRGHAVSRGRHAGRYRAEPARRAEPHECRPDPRDPSRLGRGRARPAHRRGARHMRNAGRQGARNCADCSARCITGEGAALETLPDEELIEWPAKLTHGVPMASPVFDGAREEDIVGMLNGRGWPRRVRSRWSTGAPASRSIVR